MKQSLSKKIASFICPTDIRSTVQEKIVLVEILPRNLADIVSKPINDITGCCYPSNDELGFKSYHDAVIVSQRVALSLVGHIVPQNFLFVFGETVESLQNAFSDFSIKHSIAYQSDDWFEPVYTDDGHRDKKNQSESLAIVLCKVVDTNLFQDIFTPEQQKGAGYCRRYEITWSDLNEIHDRLCKIGYKFDGHTLNPDNHDRLLHQRDQSQTGKELQNKGEVWK